MKYAVLAMIATYFLTFACSPEKPEHEQPKTETVSHEAVVAEKTHEKAVAVEHQTEATEVQAAGVEEKQADPAANQWEAIAQSAGNTVKALMEKDASGKAEAPAAEAPKEQAAAEQPAPGVAEGTEQQAAEGASEVIVMPCGQVVEFKKGEELPPCAQETPEQQEQVVTREQEQPAEQPTAAPAPQAEEQLGLAMRNMVDATNQMVSVAQQLLDATQQMLMASKGVATEMVDTTKEIIEDNKAAAKEAQSTGQQDMMESMKRMLDATKDVIDATGRAISSMHDDAPAKQQ